MPQRWLKPEWLVDQYRDGYKAVSWSIPLVLKHGEQMPSSIQIGSILVSPQLLMTEHFGLESDSYSQNWSVIRAVNGFSLDRTVLAAGWHSFFMATEVQANAFGSIRAGSVRAALQRIFLKVRGEDFNCLEVTGIAARNFFGIPYVVVSAHSRHIQKGFRLDQAHERRAAQNRAVWAKT
jgi:hypothetical protein